MFPFSTMNAPDNLKSIFNSELGLYNAASGKAYDVALKIADLNLELMKQARANWAAQSEQIKQMDGNIIPPLMDTNQFKKNVEIATSYGQHMTKIMLDLQSDMLKVAQQQATKISSTNESASDAQEASMANPNFPGISMLQSMVEQASKGYADWNSSVLHSMDAAGSNLAHQAASKGSNNHAKSRNAK